MEKSQVSSTTAMSPHTLVIILSTKLSQMLTYLMNYHMVPKPVLACKS